MARFMEPVVVIGLGRFGSALATELVRVGTEVLAIDARESVVQRLAGQLGQVVTADSTDIDALRALGVDNFERAVVAIGNDQQSSILTTALLAELEIGDIWAKALDGQHARILARVGAHHVVQPEVEMGERIAHLVSGRMLDYIGLDRDWGMVKAHPPRDIVGTPLGQTRLRARHRVTVVSVKAEGQEDFTYADAETVLRYGDEILVVGRLEDLERFASS